MKQLFSLLLTFVAGLFFLIGGLISLKVKDKEKLNHFSIGLAFVIIISLLLFDLAPEVIELLEHHKISTQIIISISFILFGIFILRILDHFIPDHHHDHHEKNDNLKEHTSHIKHIGLLTIISLMLHNVLEGFAIFGMAQNDFKIGLFTCLSVALHNIPLGTHIFSSLEAKNNSLLIGLLTLSSFLGGLIFLIIGNVSNLILAIITLITIGMLIYIAFFELAHEVIQNKKNKFTIMGIICGIIILVISLLI